VLCHSLVYLAQDILFQIGFKDPEAAASPFAEAFELAAPQEPPDMFLAAFENFRCFSHSQQFQINTPFNATY